MKIIGFIRYKQSKKFILLNKKKGEKNKFTPQLFSLGKAIP